jgi:outer membrane lipoprotein carrier protein
MWPARTHSAPALGLVAVVRAAGIVTLLLTAAATAAAAERAPADLEEIAAIQRKIQTLRARFVQRRRVELFAEELVSRGGFYFKRPDRFRWDVDEPFRASMILADGKILTTDGDGTQAHAAPLPVSATDIAGLLTGSVDVLRGLFEVQMPPSAGGQERLELRPLKPALARTVRLVTLELAPQEKYVQRMVLEEASGDRIEITFDDVQVNAVLPDALFTLEQDEAGGR